MKRTVFWKRMTALALAAILLLGLLPAAAFGAEPSDELVQTKYVYEETDGICRAVREEDALPEKPAAQSAGASAQSSGKLATPTNLRWETAYKEYMEEHDGLSYFEKVYPGCISWDDSKNSVEDYCIVFYDASGNEVCRSYWVKDPEMDSYHADDFLTHIEVSGTYRFSVQAIDEDDPSRNSEIAYSDWWPYYRPNQTLDVPVGLYADGTTLHWPAVARAGGYYVQKGYSETADDDIFWYGATWWRRSNDTEYDITRGEHNRDILTTAGYYFYHVRTLSNDITKYNNSGYGELYRVYSDGKGNLSKAENKTYTVNFEDPDRGICLKSTSGLLSGSLIPQPDVPKRTGYRFVGWYPNRSRSGNAWNFRTNVITGNLTLYAKWELIGFSQPNDVLPFMNDGTYFCSANYYSLTGKEQDKFTYEITDKDFSRLLKNLPWYDLIGRIQVRNSKGSVWGGSCFGMSSVAVLVYGGIINPSNYGCNGIDGMNITMNQKGSKDVGQVESLVNYYHLMQVIGKIANARGSFSPWDESKNLKNLIDTMRAADGSPVVIGLKFPGGGHAVVGYDLQYDATLQKYTIQIYDCSQSKYRAYPLSIYKDGETYIKACPEWQAAWSNAGEIFIKYTLTANTFLQMPYLKHSAQEAGAETPADYRLTTSFDSFTVSNGTNSTTVTGGEIVGEDALGLTVLGGEGEPGFALSFVTLLPALETGAYTITPSGGAGEEYTLDLLYDDDANGFFHSLTSAAPASVTLSSTGTLTTKTDASAAQTLTSAYNGSQIAADGVTVSGETTGFTARLENGAVSVTSQQETQAELTLSSGLKEQTQTLPLGSSAVTLQADASDETCEITRGSETLASVSLGYAVVFDARGGSQTPTQFVQSGQTAVVPDEPEYNGYLFHGWFADEACTEPWSFDTAVTEDQILYADWRPNPAMWKTVVFRVNGVDDQLILVQTGDTLTAADIPAADLYAGAKIVWDQEELAQLLDTPIWKDHVIPGDAVPLAGQSVLTLNAAKSADGVTATVKNDAAINFQLTLFAVAYDAGGRMLDCQAVPFTAEAGESTTVTAALFADAAVVRCYLIDSRFIPVCPRVELN